MNKSILLILAYGLFAAGLSESFSRTCCAEDGQAEQANTIALMVAAGGAQSSGNTEEAGFLFYAAQLLKRIVDSMALQKN